MLYQKGKKPNLKSRHSVCLLSKCFILTVKLSVSASCSLTASPLHFSCANDLCPCQQTSFYWTFPLEASLDEYCPLAVDYLVIQLEEMVQYHETGKKRIWPVTLLFWLLAFINLIFLRFLKKTHFTYLIVNATFCSLMKSQTGIMQHTNLHLPAYLKCFSC